MNDVIDTRWHRMGTSVVWHPDLIKSVHEAHPAIITLRETILWLAGTPIIDVAAQQPVLVVGLQTCLELARSATEAEQFLSQTMLGVIQRWQTKRPDSGLIFVLNGKANQWTFDANDLGMYRIRSDLAIGVTAALWNGAARDVARLMVEERVGKAGKSGKIERILGGLYVRRLS
jgi:hypothetical protein